MAAQKVADMTVEELKALIASVVDERLRLWLQPQRTKDTRSVQEVLEAMDRLRWTPPPGAPSTLQLLREDRDR